MTGTPHLPRMRPTEPQPEASVRRAGPPSPAQRIALRVLIDEVRDDEMHIARLRHRVALLRTGVHPQQQLVEAILGWGFALHDNYGPASPTGGVPK